MNSTAAGSKWGRPRKLTVQASPLWCKCDCKYPVQIWVKRILIDISCGLAFVAHNKKDQEGKKNSNNEWERYSFPLLCPRSAIYYTKTSIARYFYSPLRPAVGKSMDIWTPWLQWRSPHLLPRGCSQSDIRASQLSRKTRGFCGVESLTNHGR